MAWIAFNFFVLVMLAFDLGLFGGKGHTVGFNQALKWSAVWVALALLFAGGVYYIEGPALALQFLTGYVVEQSLSIDNLFVFLVIFSHFKVPAELQHRVLFWGIIGALVMRAIFIFAGIELIHHFSWMTQIFGLILIVTGYKLIRESNEEFDPEKSFWLKLFRKLLPVSDSLEAGNFFVKKNGRWVCSLMFLVLTLVEITDLLFAIDSIPAVLAISRDPFIVYTSNVFAILGLRSMYFVVGGVMQLFDYLHYGLAFILVFLGIKMVGHGYFEVSIGLTLLVIGLSLGLSMGYSIWKKRSRTL